MRGTIASIPRTSSLGKFMALMFRKGGLNMALINKSMGEQMLDLCNTAKIAKIADRLDNTIGIGDRVSKLLQQLGSIDIVILRPHHIIGRHSMDVSTVMAESTRHSSWTNKDNH
jgi:hypothetical protein